MYEILCFHNNLYAPLLLQACSLAFRVCTCALLYCKVSATDPLVLFFLKITCVFCERIDICVCDLNTTEVEEEEETRKDVFVQEEARELLVWRSFWVFPSPTICTLSFFGLNLRESKQLPQQQEDSSSFLDTERKRKRQP